MELGARKCVGRPGDASQESGTFYRGAERVKTREKTPKTMKMVRKKNGVQYVKTGEKL